MFSRPTGIFFSFILIVSLALNQPVAALLALLVLLMTGLAQFWRYFSLRRVEIHHVLSHRQAFPDDEVELAVHIINRKLLPLTHIEVFEQFPKGAAITQRLYTPHEADTPENKIDQVIRAQVRTINCTVGLGWYEALTWRYLVRCSRGLYEFGPTHVRSGDPFGILFDQRDIGTSERLIVYPRLLPEQELGFSMRLLLGALRKTQHMIVDPARTIGARDYHRDDPMKSIHWNATARHGQLQTRVYEPATALSVMCLLDVETYERMHQGIWIEQFEWLASLTGTICTALVSAGHGVGLWTNGATIERQVRRQLPPGHHPQQLTRIMETLALLMPYSAGSMGRMLRVAPPKLAPGTMVLLISAVWSEETLRGLTRLQQRGHPVLVVAAGEAPPGLARIPVYHSPYRADQPQKVAP